MKRILFCIVMMLCFVSMTNAQNVVRQGNNFSAVSSASTTNDTKTKFTWTDSKGKVYPIFVGKSGSCYVVKVSNKSGKEYKQYLGAEVSTQVCKELGIKYQPKK